MQDGTVQQFERNASARPADEDERNQVEEQKEQCEVWTTKFGRKVGKTCQPMNGSERTRQMIGHSFARVQIRKRHDRRNDPDQKQNAQCSAGTLSHSWFERMHDRIVSVRLT